MIKGKLLSYGDECIEVFKIRQNVFGEEKQEDYNDYNIHVLVEDNSENYVATGTISYINDKYVISHIAVLENYRKKRYGDFVVRMLVNKAFMSGAKEVELECSKDISLFFEKIGFEKNNEENNMFHMKLLFSNFKTACGHNCK